MTRYHNINGEHVAFSDAEEAERNAEEKSWADGETDRNLEILRRERNAKLAASDWTQGRDVSLENDAEWQTYREALRRLPEIETDFSNPTWPTEPSQ